MEGFPPKLSRDLHSFGYGGTAQSVGTVGSSARTSLPSQPSASASNTFMTQQTRPSNQSGDRANLLIAPGPSGQDEAGEGPSGPGGGGRKKKKKQKSGDDCAGSSKAGGAKADNLLDDTGAVPACTDTQGGEDLLYSSVEDLVHSSTRPGPGGSAGGQFNNNSLLDQILTEKKMQLLQSPDVMEYLNKLLKK